MRSLFRKSYAYMNGTIIEKGLADVVKNNRQLVTPVQCNI